MTLRTLFEKQVFIRLADDHMGFICTTKWPFFSRTRRVSVDQAGRGFAPQVRNPGWNAPEELPVLRPSAIEQGSTHKTAEFERRLREL